MNETPENPYVVVLGIAQDAGYPQANCNKICCQKAWENSKYIRNVSCIGLVDPISKDQWVFDVTPDIKTQLNILEKTSNINPLSGAFLTHAHIGHYTGLINFGKEVMGTNNLPVYVMERMRCFLENNAPWDQLVKSSNIKLKSLNDEIPISINERVQIMPFLVPHRDEYSETVGYKIITKEKSLIFIPDIDKWYKWHTNIIELIKKVDYAFLDATFYQNGELERDMSEIPHPFVSESMNLFSTLNDNDKKKIHFIHFNHTNPLLLKNSKEQKEVRKLGFKIAEEGQIISL
tara:strand:- start:4646 stop:5515 length:870 start_codon:yes stop_codon:yes gene_type:complete